VTRPFSTRMDYGTAVGDFQGSSDTAARGHVRPNRHHQWSVFLILLLVVGLGGLLLPDQAGASSRSTRPTCSHLALGVHVDLAYEPNFAQQAAVVRAARTVLHAQVVRTTLPWDRIEPTAGRFQWAVMDHAIARVVAAGMQPLLVLKGSPPWANRVPTTINGHALYVPSRAQTYRSWLSSLIAFIHVAAVRYRGEVSKWEIWNEPNLIAFWRPAPSVERYAQLFTAAAKAINAVDATADVATGGVANLTRAWGSGNITGITFLQELVSRGVRPAVVAVHAYTTPPHDPTKNISNENNFSDIARVHSMLVRYGIHARLWVTEWGWSSQTVGVSAQAKYVNRSLLILLHEPYVTVATYFIDHDRPPRFYQGLLDSSLSPKPAARRFAAIAQRLQPCNS
jgi:polysaccharide biosynthesis protein PslG